MPPKRDKTKLSEFELAVLIHLDLTNTEIAEELDATQRQVDYAIENIRRVFGMHLSRVGLAWEAVRQGIIQLPPPRAESLDA